MNAISVHCPKCGQRVDVPVGARLVEVVDRRNAMSYARGQVLRVSFADVDEPHECDTKEP